MDPGQLVTDFCGAWATRDVDAVVDYFSDDAVYHNIPMDPVVGPAAIRGFIGYFLDGLDEVEYRVLNQAVNGNVVFNERVDTFARADGASFSVKVAGIFEISDGKIVAWRDYFDMKVITDGMAVLGMPIGD